MDYPIKMITCGLCGRQYTDADGGCDCMLDKFLCPECGAVQAAEAKTYPKLRIAGYMRRVGWIVCADCALCEACQDAPGTVLEECGIGTFWWICKACAEREG